MPSIHDTAYPRFKKNIHRRELEEIYTPTPGKIKHRGKNPLSHR
jgi:hypothetical protein